MDHEPVFILDNGAHTIKAGWSHEQTPAISIPNGIFRSKRDNKTYIASQLDECDDFGGLIHRLPFEKGILTNWDIEKPTWDKVFAHPALKVDPQASALLVTEPPFNLPNVAQAHDQIIFEEYEFKSYARTTGKSNGLSRVLGADRLLGAHFVPYATLPASAQDVDGPYDEGLLPQCALVVDSGFSFTHIVPVLSGVVQWHAVIRIDVGGKLLTNYLKELISYRQWNVMEDTHVINTVKETCCYVSTNFEADQTLCKYYPRDNEIVQHYVLPDFSPDSSNKTGYVQSRNYGAATLVNKSPEKRQKDGMLKAVAAAGGEDQVLKMSNERFVVPEVLFQPSVIGLQQQGLAEAVATSIARLPDDLQGLFWSNITLVGGNCKLPGLTARLRRDLRALAPAECFVSVRCPPNPTTHTFDSIRHHLNLEVLPYPRTDSVRSTFVTRKEYLEHGSNITRRKFWATPLDPGWEPPALALREGDEIDFDSEGTVSSGHSEELARKRARWAAGEAGFRKRGKQKKTKDDAGFRITGSKKTRR